MSDTEPEIPPTPSASGTAAVVSQAHGPQFVPSNFPVPQVMVCKGDKASNWCASARKATISRWSVIQGGKIKLILSKMKTTRILISKFSQWM